jgi:hypothetical protein
MINTVNFKKYYIVRATPTLIERPEGLKIPARVRQGWPDLVFCGVGFLG